jgi:hypothetical protein
MSLDNNSMKRKSIVMFSRADQKHRSKYISDVKRSHVPDTLIGINEYINGFGFIWTFDMYAYAVKNFKERPISSWSSHRTVIKDHKHYIIVSVEDIWRFNKEDSLVTKYELKQFKLTNVIENYIGFIVGGTGKYINATGTVQTFTTDDKHVDKNVITLL